MNRPVFLFDGDCGFCSAVVARLARAFGNHVDWQPWQRARQLPAGVTADTLNRAAVLVSIDGSVDCGFDAFRALYWRVGWLRIVSWIAWLPPVAWVGRLTYALIAKRRHVVSKWLNQQSCRSSR